MLQKTIGCMSAGLNAFLLVLAMAFAVTSPETAFAATVTKVPNVDATYLSNVASWPAGSIIIGLADQATLQTTDGLDVKLISTNRCMLNPPLDDAKNPLITLPSGFYDAAGVPTSEIYNNIVNQDTAVFLAAVRTPSRELSVANYNCYMITFAYKAKPVVKTQ